LRTLSIANTDARATICFMTISWLLPIKIPQLLPHGERIDSDHDFSSGKCVADMTTKYFVVEQRLYAHGCSTSTGSTSLKVRIGTNTPMQNWFPPALLLDTRVKIPDPGTIRQCPRTQYSGPAYQSILRFSPIEHRRLRLWLDPASGVLLQSCQLHPPWQHWSMHALLAVPCRGLPGLW
jgi:hypothetical protein